MDQDLYTSMVSLREHVKLLHFQTTHYAVHKATDKFLTEYDDLFDTFWESKQAGNFRVILGGTQTIKLNNARTYEELEPVLTRALNHIQSETEDRVIPSRDALIELIAKFQYIMTFK